MIEMVSGEPIDAQRERRWPHSGMVKEFKPERGDPGYNSDEEDIKEGEWDEEGNLKPRGFVPPELAGDVGMEVDG